MRRVICVTVAAVLVGVAPWALGQDQKAEIQKKLTSQFVLTKTTADKTDIVTPGSILVLQKDGLLMFSTDTKYPPTTTYKDGKLSIGFAEKFGTGLALGQAQPGATFDNVPQRKFVSGEKFWIVAFSVKDDGVILMFCSDPYSDVRYYGQVKFPFKKHAFPPADEVMKTIAEVLTVQPTDEASEATQQTAAPDTPPPPPKTIALGQTKDQVLAIMGQPQKVANLGAKEIDYYPDMKITFLNGRVTDVQ
jgi:hypothetical protein